MDKGYAVLKVFDVISSELAVSHEDGEKVYDKLKGLLDSKQKVSIDFSGINLLATPFLNVAIGRFLSTEYKDDFNCIVKFENIDSDDKKLIELVLERAKKFFEEQRENK